MSEIRLIQCLCARSHPILAVLYDTTALSPKEARTGFEALIEEFVDARMVDRRCAICGTETTFHYADGITTFESMAQADVSSRQAFEDLRRKALKALRN